QQPGGGTKLFTTVVGSSSGLLRFEVEGNNLRLYLNDALIGSATNSVLSSAGGIGFRMVNATLDDFEASTFVQLPAFPTGVSATDGMPRTMVTITWNSASGADSYPPWRNTTTASSMATQLVSGLVTTLYEDTPATPGTQYYYWLKTVDGAFSSEFSAGAA